MITYRTPSCPAAVGIHVAQAQLMLPDHDGKTVPELARSNGQGATADWLEALARELGLTPERSRRELGFVEKLT